MIGRRVGRAGGGPAIGGDGSALGIAASPGAAGKPGVVAGNSVGAGLGSLRTEVGTSGRGANSATRASISRRLRPQALAITASWFSVVRCRLSSRTDVRDI